jgi:hypothetical protein
VPRQSFYDVVTEAVADLTAHGFDSADRVAYWAKRLREAAEASMGSAHAAEQQLRDSLAAIYRRLVDNGGVLKHHPGVHRFTVEKLAPRLRAELDRRILASASLIKLNREQAVAKTIQRLSGWATSIPEGGSETVDRREVKAHIAKPIWSSSFEERRCAIDQGHKLAASINEVIARDSGAIAVEWRSHWRQPGYAYRPDHKERDGKVYLLRDSWARESGLVKPGDAGCYEDVTAVGEEPFCRCFATYLYHLRQMPSDMLTAKGVAELERARKIVAATAS